MRALSALARLFIHPYRRLYLTPRGWIFCALTVAMGAVAMNTGHNLFHLIFGFLLSAIVVSGVLSEMILRGVSVQRIVPGEVTARVAFPVRLELRNTRRRQSVFAVNVTDGGDFFVRRNVGYLASLKPGEKKELSYLVAIEKRGSYEFGSLGLSTRFPFGLFEKVRLLPLSQPVVAYPGHRETPPLRRFFGGDDSSGLKKRRTGEEVLSIRPALPDDDHRLIHWRTTARRGELAVKEMAERQQVPCAIFFDNRGAAGERFERGVEIAASLLRALAKAGVPVSFSTWEEHFMPAGSGALLRAALRHLAVVTPSRAAREAGFKAWCAQSRRSEGGIFLKLGDETPSLLPPCRIVSL
ncbi:MAG TPA: DUF58 domain-containing protein [Candidatus Acidoferrales bacterium]|nr:DUF58 domain-containing protein [Candidatus Acidoferrales bacterium]